MLTHDVRGGGGVDLHVVETGDPDGRPALFLHGFSQSLHSWTAQLDSDLGADLRLVAMDLRGHGRSDKPRDAYGDSALWAEDVAAVVSELDLSEFVIVGWSYSGLTVLDYVEVHGTDDLAGANLIAIAHEIGPEANAEFLDPGYLELMSGMTSTDAAESVEALSAFVRRCVGRELTDEEFYHMLGYNAVVPPYVRAGLRDRETYHEDTLDDLDVPVWFTHGEEDRVVYVGNTEVQMEFVSDGRLSVYPDAGHSPFWENPERYNRELGEFVDGL